MSTPDHPFHLADATSSAGAQQQANKELVLKVMSLLVNPETAEQVRPLLTESYIQHNPNIASGADSIIAFTRTPEAARARQNMRPATAPPVLIAEGDKVVMMLVRELPHPDDPSRTYNSYWFDMWRVEDGKLAEHWDGALKEAP